LSALQVSLGGTVPIHPIYKLSRTFSENNSGTIPLVSENKEKSWKHRFHFSKYVKLAKENASGEGPTHDS